MNKELNKIVKSYYNNVLGIGISLELMDLIDKNDDIKNCDILSNDVKKDKNQKRKLFGGKRIDINKLKKRYKKKSIDFIICDYEVISLYMKKFVKNSVYINKNKLYFYGNVDVEFVKTKYGRYDTLINIKKYKDGYIVEIDNTKSKNNFIKELFYSIKDTTVSIIEIVGDVLMG